MLKILVMHPDDYTRATFFPAEIKEQLTGMGEVVWNAGEEGFTEERLAGIIGDIDICLGGWDMPVFTPRVFDAAKKLKYIGQVGGSVKHYLTNEEVFDRGIAVSNAAAGIAKYVAEGTLTFILAALKDLCAINHTMKVDKGDPSGAFYTETLFGKKVGLIGFGKVGREMLPLLRPFGVEVGVYDPYLPTAEAEALGVRKAELTDLLRESDIVSLHAPNTPETKKMLNKDTLALIKPGALFVNTARAAIVDELALLGELKKGRFRAALDVFWKEPLPVNHELRRLPNVILTPHSIASAVQQRPEQAQMVIDDIRRFLTGQTPENVITREIYRIMA